MSSARTLPRAEKYGTAQRPNFGGVPERSASVYADAIKTRETRSSDINALFAELRALANIDFVCEALLPPSLGARLQKTDDFVRRRAIMYADIDVYEKRDAELREALARLSRPRAGGPEGFAERSAEVVPPRPRETERASAFTEPRRLDPNARRGGRVADSQLSQS